MFLLAHPNASNFELKSPTNMTLSERLLMVSKSEKFGFPSTPFRHLGSLGENFLVNNCGMYDSF